MSNINHIAVAGFTHETNTFAPQPTELRDFGARGGGGIPEGLQTFERVESKTSFQGFCAAARAAGHKLHPLLHAYAPPGGTIRRDAFELLCGRILQGLENTARVDAVFLELHGAMVAEGVPRADAQLLQRIRDVVGPDIPIVAALDSHGNIDHELVNLADALVAYRTYPHVDMPHTGERALRLLEPLLEKQGHWHRAFADVPYLMALSRQATVLEPGRALYAELEAAERAHPDVTLSVMTGFPLADVRQCRPCVFGYGRDERVVRSAVAQVHARMLSLEPEFRAQIADVDTAVAHALRADKGPVVLADVQDNAGGGASSDTVWVIEALLRAGATDAIVGMVYDPEVATAAHAAGVGACIEADLGGKRMPGHRPLRARFQVERLREGPLQLRGPMMGGTLFDLGRMALLRVDGVRIVVNSRRAQCLDQAYFREMGLEPGEHRIIVVKSTNHYRADFTQLAHEIVEFAAPGACAMDPSQLDYRHLASGTRTRAGDPASAFR